MISKDRVAMVTGAGSGIGKAVAWALAKSGIRVAVFDINQEFADTTAQEITEAGMMAMALSGNVGCKDTVFKAVDEIIAQWGRLDILVNAAGILIDNVIKKVTEENWDKVQTVNLKGTLFCIQAVQDIMKQQNYGRIINLASAAYLGNFGQAAYAASKAGVVSLTKVAALEMARYAVTVNSIAPGMIATPMTAGMSPEAFEKMVKDIPVGRCGQPEDVAHMVLAIAADEAGYITGQAILLDGGATIGK